MAEITGKDIKKFETGCCMFTDSEHVATIKGREIVVKASKSKGNIKGISISRDCVITIEFEWLMTKHGLWGHWKIQNGQDPIVIDLQPSYCSWDHEDISIHCADRTAKLLHFRLPKPRED